MKFIFKINNYFILQGGYIGILGDMDPTDFPFVTQKFKLQLVSKQKIIHNFVNIGEEIPLRYDLTSPRVRAFRTSDDIKNLLESANKDDLYIIGSDSVVI